LHREFVEQGFTPPSAYKHVDLMVTAKSQFKLPSNKLQYVSTWLGLDGKVSHSGFELWVKCMQGDTKAWALMRKYNKQDVVLLEQIHDRLLPWVKGLPNAGLYGDVDTVCRACASEKLEKRGFAYTDQSKFQQYRCNDCGAWTRSTRREAGVQLTKVAQ